MAKTKASRKSKRCAESPRYTVPHAWCILRAEFARKAMKFCCILLFGFLAGAGVSAAADPFVGKWIWNAQKSPLPKITYKIKDLGGDRFALTGSTGETLEIKADGLMVDSPFGGTVSLKKVNDREWQMVRKPEAFLRTYAISADDQTLTLTDVFTNPDGTAEKTEFAYARTSAGKGFIGEWQSVNAKLLTKGTGRDFIIEPYGKGGLSFVWPSDATRLDMNFDGKPYVAKGAGLRKGLTTRGTRVNAHLVKTEDWVERKVVERDEMSLSGDGKTLTSVAHPANSTAVFTSVFDKQ
jgi:hypothetical protein